MPFVHPDSTSTGFFLAICGFIVVFFLYSVYRACDGSRRGAVLAGGGLALYLSLFCTLVASGSIQQELTQRIPLTLALVNLASLSFALSPLGRNISEKVDLRYLVGFQAFRLPLELVLHSWATQGTIPETMTWTGSNFDIVSGVLALVAALFSNRSRPLAWTVNLVGLALLLNVMRVAMLSSPLPIGWGVQPPLLLLLYLPYALIVPLCVGGALAGHIILTRALMLR